MLSFLFGLTTNVDVGPTPDAFALVLLQGDGTAVHTADPSGADSLLSINIDSAHPTILTFSSDLTPAGAVRVIPEPPSALLVVIGFLVALSSTRARRPAAPFQDYARPSFRPFRKSVLLNIVGALKVCGAALPQSERPL